MIAFLFPGQGAQFVGMGRDLAEASPAARAVLEQADEVLGYPLTRLMFAGPEEDLRRTVHTQPAVVAHSLAARAALEAEGIRPDVVAGHSVGEYAAVAACGALDPPDVFRLVALRGRLMQEAGELRAGTMAAVLGLDGSRVEELCRLCRHYVEVANLNCPGQVVVSGTREGVKELEGLAREAGAARILELSVSGAFHSRLMEPACEGLTRKLRSLSLRHPRVPLVANLSARPLEDAEELRRALELQLVSRVRWEESVRRMLEMGVDIFVELGPGRALSGMVRRIERRARVLAVGDAASLDRALGELAGLLQESGSRPPSAAPPRQGREE